MDAETLASTEEKITAMAKVGRCWSPDFSPDGQTLAFVSDLSGIPQVWTIPVQGGFPRRVTALPDQIGQVCYAGEWLAFSLAPGGGMNQQIYLIKPDGTELRRLTAGGKDNNWLGEALPGGRQIAVASNQRDPNAMDAYLVDVPSGEFHLVAQNRGIGSLSDVSHDGRYAIIYRMENRGNSDLFLVDTSNGSEICLTPHEGLSSAGNARFSPDGHTIYLVTNVDRDLPAFQRIRLDDAMHPGAIETIVERDDATIDEFVLSPDGKIAALVWNVAGLGELVLLDLATNKVIASPKLPAELIYGVTFSRDMQQIAFVATGPAAPNDIHVYELASGKMHQVTHSPHPGVRLETMVRPEAVQFKAHDGLKLTGWLYRPHDFKAPGAVVLSFHGGPEGQERPWFDADYQALTGQGIAVFAPNVRGSSGFGKTFVNLDNGALRFDAIRDIKACADYVLNAGIAAPGRIGIVGGSYGGYMTMAGLVEYPELFSAGVNLFGVVNFRTFFEQTEPWMAAISKIEYGDPDTEGEMLDRLSPINRIDRVIAPTLVLHGANDTNVPVVEAEQVVENLRQRHVPVEYVLFPDEGHGFQKENNRITSTLTIVRWFVRHLLA